MLRIFEALFTLPGANEVKKMKCKLKSAKNIIGTKVSSSTKKIKDDASKSFSILKKKKE